jgi:hypothetical protein
MDRRILLVRLAAPMGQKRNARVLMGNPDGKVPLGRPRRGWEGNIKMYLRGIEWSGIDWIDLAQDRDQWGVFVNTVLNRWGSINRSEILE